MSFLRLNLAFSVARISAEDHGYIGEPTCKVCVVTSFTSTDSEPDGESLGLVDLNY